MLKDLQLLCPSDFTHHIDDELNSLLNKQEKALLTKVYEIFTDAIINL
jgi:hypothetical protein